MTFDIIFCRPIIKVIISDPSSGLRVVLLHLNGLSLNMISWLLVLISLWYQKIKNILILFSKHTLTQYPLTPYLSLDYEKH